MFKTTEIVNSFTCFNNMYNKLLLLLSQYNKQSYQDRMRFNVTDFKSVEINSANDLPDILPINSIIVTAAYSKNNPTDLYHLELRPDWYNIHTIDQDHFDQTDWNKVRKLWLKGNLMPMVDLSQADRHLYLVHDTTISKHHYFTNSDTNISTEFDVTAGGDLTELMPEFEIKKHDLM